MNRRYFPWILFLALGMMPFACMLNREGSAVDQGAGQGGSSAGSGGQGDGGALLGGKGGMAGSAVSGGTAGSSGTGGTAGGSGTGGMAGGSGTGGTAGATGGSGGAGDGCDCLPVAPGWQPIHLWAPDQPQPASPCGEGFDGQNKLVLFSGVSSSGDQCSCSCGGPKGGSCGALSGKIHSGDDCGGLYEDDISQSCDSHSDYHPYSFDVHAPEMDRGSCDVIVHKQFSKESYADLSSACRYTKDSPEQGSCSGGQICVPKADGTASCWMATGDQPCPGGLVKTLMYTEKHDTRSCDGQCVCNQPTGRTCSGKLTMFKDKNCNGDTKVGSFTWTDSNLSKCQNLSMSGESSQRLTMDHATPTGGSCAPNKEKVSPSGGVSPVLASNVTVCCPSN